LQSTTARPLAATDLKATLNAVPFFMSHVFADGTLSEAKLCAASQFAGST
jgi:hypothetical protein